MAALEPVRGGAGMWLTGALPVVHGFTTRHGGLSTGPFESLNLGLSSGDDAHLVEANRDLLLSRVGFGRHQVCAFHQVHGATVAAGTPAWFSAEADAAVTADPNTLVVVSVADCLPVLFYDPVTGAVGAAHCGWRGTVQGLAAKVAGEMAARFGSRPEELLVLLGPGISGPCYQVGGEVARQFDAAGAGAEVVWPDAEPGRYRLDIKAANRLLLERAGVPPHSIADLGLCTHCRADLFYSYRRDGQASGRHWAFISPRMA